MLGLRWQQRSRSLIAAGLVTGAELVSAQSAPPAAASERDELVTPAEAAFDSELCQSELQAEVRLSGTVYDSERPDRSLAILGKPSSSDTAVYRAGARLGALRLLAVHPTAVLFGSVEGDACWLRMSRIEPGGQAPKKKEKAAEQAKDKSKTPFSKEELDRGIQRHGDGQFNVDRGLLQTAIARMPQLAKGMRAKVVKKNGEPVGLAIRKLPKDGILARLGVKRGDVLKTINGFQVGSIDGMLTARSALSTAKRLSLAIEREGKPVTLEYSVH